MKIKFSYVIFLFFILGGCGFAAWKIVNKPQPPRSVSISAIRSENGIPVSLHEAQAGMWEYWLPLYGTVRAPRLSQVSAARQEYLTEVRVDVGDVVKSGQVIALLDTKNQVERLEAAKVRNKDLETRYNRLTSIKQAGGTSLQEAESAFTLLRDSQANLKELANEIERSKINAPLAGTVVKRDAEAGQLASPSRPLFEIADMSLIEVTLDVAPNVSSLIKPGAPAQVLTDRGWAVAAVRRINPLADEATGLYNCVLTVNNAQTNTFRLGGTVECKVLVERESSAIALPYQIVRDVAGKAVVYVASGDTAVERTVRRGRISEQNVRILSGVAAGERLVDKGIDRVYDGAKIWVQK